MNEEFAPLMRGMHEIHSSLIIPPSSFDSMPDDFFKFFRWWLAILVTVYASIITLQSLWGWYLWLAGSDRYTSLLRRYLLVQGLRLRFKAFWGDVIICGLLLVAFLMIWRAQSVMDAVELTVSQGKATDARTRQMDEKRKPQAAAADNIREKHVQDSRQSA